MWTERVWLRSGFYWEFFSYKLTVRTIEIKLKRNWNKTVSKLFRFSFVTATMYNWYWWRCRQRFRSNGSYVVISVFVRCVCSIGKRGFVRRVKAQTSECCGGRLFRRRFPLLPECGWWSIYEASSRPQKLVWPVVSNMQFPTSPHSAFCRAIFHTLWKLRKRSLPLERLDQLNADVLWNPNFFAFPLFRDLSNFAKITGWKYTHGNQLHLQWNPTPSKNASFI